MKRLKESTVKSYSNSQLLNHLENLLCQFWDSPYRIVTGSIFELDNDGSYYHSCSIDRGSLIECIEACYEMLGM